MKRTSKPNSQPVQELAIRITVSEELNKLKGKDLAPHKAENDKHIMKLKLPKFND